MPIATGTIHSAAIPITSTAINPRSWRVSLPISPSGTPMSIATGSWSTHTHTSATPITAIATEQASALACCGMRQQEVESARLQRRKFPMRRTDLPALLPLLGPEPDRLLACELTAQLGIVLALRWV